MKIYISCDIEGTAGIAHRSEVLPDFPDYAFFAEQMSREAAAAARAAFALGADRVIVRDAHNTGRNMNMRLFPEKTEFIRGWSGDPFLMMEGLDKSFDACLMIGYHSEAGRDANPLAHTISSRIISRLRINGKPASEFLVNLYTASYVGVPVVFLSGDKALCQSAEERIPRIQTVFTTEGRGGAVFSMHPDRAVSRIAEGVERALRHVRSSAGFKSLEKDCSYPLPPYFSVDLEYLDHKDCCAKQYYPGIVRVDDKTLRFEHEDWFEVLRCLHFVI